MPPSQGQALVDLQLSLTGSNGPWRTIASDLPDNGSYQWLVDSYGSTNCRIKVVLTTATQSASTVSPADFTIVGDPMPLIASVDTLPATGGTVDFSLNAGGGQAGRNYLVCASLTGTEPGTLLPGGLATIPLNRDWFTDFVLARLNTYTFTDFWGTLDPAGAAQARLNAPPVSGWIGTTLSFAYAVAAPWDFASNAVNVEIVP